MGIRIGIDTGGTFTDIVAHDGDTGRFLIGKVPSNPSDPVAAITAALEAASIDAAAVESIVVGTTIGINAVLTRRGARVVYLTTRGFEDIPYIQRINRKYHYDFTWRKPEPMVARPDCIGVDERLDEEGGVLEPLDLASALDRIAAVAPDERPTAVAVCLLYSYLNPEHEIEARAAIRERFPDLPVSLSHEIAPIWREYERGTTATVDAYLKPLVERYVDGVTSAFRSRGIERPWSLLKSNGGQSLSEQARERPAHLLLSGIAGGAIAAAYVARAAGAGDAIMLDMGGTSCDVCLIADGEPRYSSDYEIEFGLPVSVPSVSTRTIGAGGGSIGWVDPGGFLQVGPQSAGAEPGPACYGSGGSEATITDANVELGRLSPGFFLGGRMQLDGALATAALERVGATLGRGAAETAQAMVRVTNENMANAIRIVTVQEGIDPREHALVAFGGAGPTHGCEIADAIGMRRVLVPPDPGVTSAFGALAASPRVDAVRSVYLVDSRLSAATLDRLFAELEAQARADIAAQGLPSEPDVRRIIAMRYQGQNYEQDVTVAPRAIDDDTLAAIYDEYGRLYEGFYGYRLDGIPVETVRLSVIVSGPAPAFGTLGSGGGDHDAAGTTRPVWFPGHEFVGTAVVRRSQLAAAATLAGPAIVESMDSTVVVPPGWSLKVADTGILDLRRAD